MTQAFNLSQLGNTINSSGQVSLTAGVTGTLPIANGGTNLTSAGTSGYVLTSNGSAFTMVAPSGGQPQYDLFASSGTWTCPAGVTRVKVTCIGGGGGNSGGSNTNGGGGGGVGIGYFTVTPGTAYTITVGSGGAGVTSGNAGSGTSSSFGALITSTGGGGMNNLGTPGAGGTSANSSFGTSTSIWDGSFDLSNVVITSTYSGCGPFYGRCMRMLQSNSLPAVAWSLSSKYLPGAPGVNDTETLSKAGGIGGAIAIEYIG